MTTPGKINTGEPHFRADNYVGVVFDNLHIDDLRCPNGVINVNSGVMNNASVHAAISSIIERLPDLLGKCLRLIIFRPDDNFDRCFGKPLRHNKMNSFFLFQTYCSIFGVGLKRIVFCAKFLHFEVGFNRLIHFKEQSNHKANTKEFL